MKVSVVFSFRNEESGLEALIRRTRSALQATGADYEMIFVNDDSTDRSLELLRKQRESDPGIKIITMSRRFGVHACVLAGMRLAAGDAVVYMDSDLQDPPELIPELVKTWQAGADVVNTVRTRRLGENPFRMWLTRKAYQVINAMSEIDLPVNMGDFKLLSRRVVNEVLALNDYDPFMRGLVRWVGFKQETVYYVRDPRYAGTTHFSLFGSGPAKEFIRGITSFSIAPLYLVLVYGLIVSASSLLFALLAGLAQLLGAAVPGWSFLLALLVFLAGNILAAIGVVGAYLGRTYNQSRNRPLYIIKEKQGFDGA